MEWISDVAIADWLRERLDDEWSMHHFVPHGFDAYARVFHPAEVRSLPDGAVPTTDEWMRMPDAEQQRLMELLIDAPASWADAADAFGTTMHELAQWARIVATPPEADWHTRVAPDGREFTSPDEGRMPVATLAALASVLAQHTGTPDDGFVGVWEGWGGLVGGHGGNGRAFFGFTDEPRREPMWWTMWWSRQRANFENPFRKATWHSGILSDEISKGPRLELPDRDHVLFSAAPVAFADPDWVLDAPWRDREAEGHGFSPSAQHPSILWPADRAWVMVSEIDDDSTIIAGSNELIQAICADPTLEALPLPEGSTLLPD
ncbi:MAG: hypothetical protein ACTH2E_06955 [Microbacterium sp.]